MSYGIYIYAGCELARVPVATHPAMSTPYTADSQPLALPAAQPKRSTTRSYNASMQPRRVRISALFYPAPNLTNEQLKKYWLEEHGKIFMSLDIVRKNLTKYEQVRHVLNLVFDERLITRFACAVAL